MPEVQIEWRNVFDAIAAVVHPCKPPRSQDTAKCEGNRPSVLLRQQTGEAAQDKQGRGVLDRFRAYPLRERGRARKEGERWARGKDGGGGEGRTYRRQEGGKASRSSIGFHPKSVEKVVTAPVSTHELAPSVCTRHLALPCPAISSANIPRAMPLRLHGAPTLRRRCGSEQA